MKSIFDLAPSGAFFCVLFYLFSIILKICPTGHGVCHSLAVAVDLPLLKIRKMGFWHKAVYYSQFIILTVFIVVGLLFMVDRLWIKILTYIFFFSEIFLLEAQRKIKPELIRYQKSGIFALGDLFAVMVFMIYAVLFVFTSRYAVYPPFFFGILIYTLIRKIYIYKNFSYDL